MNIAKLRRAFICILAIVALTFALVMALPVSAEASVELAADLYPEESLNGTDGTLDLYGTDALPLFQEPNGTLDPTIPHPFEPDYVIVPETTGYAVGAFDTQPQQASAMRADVLPFMRSDAAPDFSLQTTKGDFQGLSSYNGRFVIITFWTSWKDDCLSSLTALRQAVRQYPDMTVLAVNSLPAENNNVAWTEEAFLGHIAWINSYFEEKGFPFPALLDINGQVSSAYHTDQLPMTYFIDREGVIRIPWPGALTADSLDTLLGMMTALDRF
ncbi:hypothetical protein AGMMS49992_00780 [Clostridia bacterium]|nr:hypothetical protein AGMMS49992_00780 [Clostridia bacterium]